MDQNPKWCMHPVKCNVKNRSQFNCKDCGDYKEVKPKKIVFSDVTLSGGVFGTLDKNRVSKYRIILEGAMYIPSDGRVNLEEFYKNFGGSANEVTIKNNGGV